MKEKTRYYSTFSSIIKRHWMKPIVSLVMIAIMLCNSSSSMNMVVQAATDPVAYYQKVEKANLDQQVDKLTDAYTNMITDYQKALKQQVGQETTIQATLDSSITEGTSYEGLKSIKTKMLSMVNGLSSKTDIGISCNDQELTSFEAFMTNDIYYLLIPDLSKAFLKSDVNSLEGDTTSSELQNSIYDFINDPVSADLLNKVMKKYGNIVFDNIKNVTINKNVPEATYDEITKYTRLDISINQKAALNISKAILTAAKSDTELRDMFVDLGICTKKEYSAAISESLTSVTAELKDLQIEKSNGPIVLKMYLWVDGNGKIAGRSFKIDTGYEVLNLGYRTAQIGTKVCVEAWVSSDGQDIMRGMGSFTAGLLGVSGEFEISYTDSYTETKSKFNIDFKNVKYTKDDISSFLNGAFTITSDELKNTSFNLTFTGESGKQDILFDMVQDSKSIVTVSTTSKIVPYSEFSLPSSTDKIYDMDTVFDKYLEDSDLKGFLEGIKEKSDVAFIDTYIDTLIGDME